MPKKTRKSLELAVETAEDWLYENVERPVRHNRKVNTAVKVGVVALVGGLVYKLIKGA